MQPLVSIVIPNWNGRDFIARCLAGTLQSAQESGCPYECIVVDDASNDGSPEIVERNFSRVRLIRQSVNRGFGATVNEGANAASGEILVCLNNDLVPKGPLIRELVLPLVENHALFGVSGKTVDWKDGTANHLNMAAQWYGGELHLTHENSKAPAPTMFLQGGCCAMRRAEFLSFGGFSALFAPGYWEDYDVSYLALKAGWQNLYNPHALAYHFGGGSMRRALGEDGLRIVQERNRHLFVLANMTDERWLGEYYRTLPRRVAFAREPRLRVRAAALAETLKRLRQIQDLRAARAKWQKRTDHEVFGQFALHGKT
ncbi:MAG: glycosyltransferase family 2 protein [Candidatus Sumerlaeaceae bacterium]